MPNYADRFASCRLDGHTVVIDLAGDNGVERHLLTRDEAEDVLYDLMNNLIRGVVDEQFGGEADSHYFVLDTALPRFEAAQMMESLENLLMPSEEPQYDPLDWPYGLPDDEDDADELAQWTAGDPINWLLEGF